MINSIRVTNFKSLVDVTVVFTPVTVLIGRSGTGKTNFVEAIRWLRDALRSRNFDSATEKVGGWAKLMAASTTSPRLISWETHFTAPGVPDEFSYRLSLHQQRQQHQPQLHEEKLSLGNRCIFQQVDGKWAVSPPGNLPQAGSLVLGALTGIRESTVAYGVLSRGIGCYAFPDDVLTSSNQIQGNQATGFQDRGQNYVEVFKAIHDHPTQWQQVGQLAAALKSLKPSLQSVDLILPAGNQIHIKHTLPSQDLSFDLGQESEGFRRLLACLLALYQEPPKETLIFDEPEKGIYPSGLAVLAAEFKGYTARKRGQVLLTTHSPEFLDHFEAEQIRVVEMHDYQTRIGPISSEQMEALREHYLQTKELLTVDEARLEVPLAEAK